MIMIRQDRIADQVDGEERGKMLQQLFDPDFAMISARESLAMTELTNGKVNVPDVAAFRARAKQSRCKAFP